MKLNKFMAAVASLGFAASVFAANQGEGTFDFKGSIIEAPCSVDETNTTKEVNLGQVSDVLLKAGGKSTPQDIKITLKDCSIATKTKVKTTLTGAASTFNANLLGISGNASGAGIAIVDGSGTPIELGKATANQLLKEGTNFVKFTAYLQGDSSATAAIKPGSFTSTATWALSYE